MPPRNVTTSRDRPPPLVPLSAMTPKEVEILDALFDANFSYAGAVSRLKKRNIPCEWRAVRNVLKRYKSSMRQAVDAERRRNAPS